MRLTDWEIALGLLRLRFVGISSPQANLGLTGVTEIGIKSLIWIVAPKWRVVES